MSLGCIFFPLIISARKIKIFEVHETGLAAQYFSYRLASIGIDSETVRDTGIFGEKATMSTQEDLNIFFSLSAETFVIKDSIQFSREAKSKNI